MRYKCYCLNFPNGLHVGGTSLDESEMTFSADTLFSALFQEAILSDKSDMLLGSVKSGKLLLSDAFPYIGETLYLPKPILRVNVKDSKGDSVQKKAFKKLDFIPVNEMDTYLSGKMDAAHQAEKLKEMSATTLKTSAAIHGVDETLLYGVGVRYFAQNAGLYVLCGTENDDVEGFLYDLLDSLSFSGIGGKRRSGIGRFTITKEKEMPSYLFEGNASRYMSLSISLPREDELDSVLEDAFYQIRKRGGFVASETYADEPLKKKEIYMVAAGATFAHKYDGDVYDVSVAGLHPVYHYGKPIFYVLPEVK